MLENHLLFCAELFTFFEVSTGINYFGWRHCLGQQRLENR
jgi:hypothetical protein